MTIPQKTMVRCACGHIIPIREAEVFGLEVWCLPCVRVVQEANDEHLNRLAEEVINLLDAEGGLIT